MKKNTKILTFDTRRAHSGLKTGWIFKSGKISQIHCVEANEFTICGTAPPLFNNWVGSRIPMSVAGKSNLCPKCLAQIGSAKVFKAMPWDTGIFEYIADARNMLKIIDPKKHRITNRKHYDGKKRGGEDSGLFGVET